jgi:hypothetical protein
VPRGEDTVLELLAIHFEPEGGESPGGTMEFVFAGGGAIRLSVECVEAAMDDLGPMWAGVADAEARLTGAQRAHASPPPPAAIVATASTVAASGVTRQEAKKSSSGSGTVVRSDRSRPAASSAPAIASGTAAIPSPSSAILQDRRHGRRGVDAHRRQVGRREHLPEDQVGPRVAREGEDRVRRQGREVQRLRRERRAPGPARKARR